MIKMYKRSSGGISCVKAERWLRQNKMEYTIITSHDITSQVLREMLCLSSNGFEDILISKSKGRKAWELLSSVGISPSGFGSMSTEKLIEFLVSYPAFLKSPILFNEKYLLPGFNIDEIRVFISREYRDVEYAERKFALNKEVGEKAAQK